MSDCRRIRADGGRSVGFLRTAALLISVSTFLSPSLQPLSAQQTRAERSGYSETSTHADVLSFLDSLERAAPERLVRGEFGRTTEGRVLPFVVASRPLVRTAAEARATGKPIVFVQGNIHGGEVEGKESLQAILRDLVLDAQPNVLDSIILIALPIYNADGNEQWGPQERQRGSQNGPAQIGLRPNGQQLDLNRDYIKVEAPETKASLRFFAQWNPDVFVDLHTTNGSYHGYALTYSPSLHPAAMNGALAPAGPFTRDTLLPELRRLVSERHNIETFDYGNFSGVGNGRDDPTSLKKGGWYTYEHKPRFGTNYHGLHNRVSILSEAYSHDPFARRVEATTAFVQELLSLVAARGAQVTARTRAEQFASRPPVPLRATMTATPFDAPVLVEQLEATGDSTRYEPGLRPGFRRTHRFTPVTMPVYDRFDATLARALPTAWAIDASNTAAIERLAYHGIELSELMTPVTIEAERFIVDSIIRAPRPFQGHQEVRVEGRWVPSRIELGPGTLFVRAERNNALLAAILLEPESDDGFTTWNVFDAGLEVGRAHPVRRIVGTLPAPPAR